MNESSNHEHPGLKRRCIFGWEAPLLPAAHRSRQNSQIRGRENIYGGKLRIGRRLAGRTDGILQQKPVVAAWWGDRGVGSLVELFFVCLLVLQVVMTAPRVGRRWSWSRLPLGRPKGQVVLGCGRTGRVENKMSLWGCFVLNHQVEKTDVEDTNIASKTTTHTLVPCPICTPCNASVLVSFFSTLWDWTYDFGTVSHPLYLCALQSSKAGQQE